MLADNPELTLYEKDHKLYVGYNYNDFYSDDIFITDVDL